MVQSETRSRVIEYMTPLVLVNGGITERQDCCCYTQFINRLTVGKMFLHLSLPLDNKFLCRDVHLSTGSLTVIT